MSGPSSIEFSVEATLSAVRLLAASLRGLLRDWHFPDERAATLELALVEAATNVVRHAYREMEPQRIRVRVKRAGQLLEVLVLDTGRSFDPSAIPPPPEPDPADPSTWPEGGMGLSIIRSACDEMTYSSSDGENALRLVVREGWTLPRP